MFAWRFGFRFLVNSKAEGPGGLNRMSADAESSRDPLDPLAPPVRSLERVREILGLVHDLAVAKLHDAHRKCWPPLVGDDVFGNPEITFSEDFPDVETRGLAWVMAP